MKTYLYFLVVALLATMPFFLTSCDNQAKTDSSTSNQAETDSSTSVVKNSPIYMLFQSEQSLKDGLIGKNFVSSDKRCIIDFRRETRYKIFIKENINDDWTQFDGEKYRITYNSNDELCIEFDYLDQNGGDENAKGVFTPSDFTLTYFHGKTLKFGDFKITTADEARTIYNEGKK